MILGKYFGRKVVHSSDSLLPTSQNEDIMAGIPAAILDYEEKAIC